MVVSKDGKRKRKDSPIVETSPEVPKRTKVQAQRKFAQGQGNPSASYSASPAAVASSSQPSTPSRENKEPPPELITHKKPSAEDLVTYICFRGTPGLPPHLDFFNQNKNNSKKDEIDKEANEVNKPSSTNKKIEKKEPPPIVVDKSDKKIEKPETMTFAVRKRADQVVEGNRKFKNNDRLTRLRDRFPKKEETNRRSPRTRSTKPDNEDDFDDDDAASTVSDEKETLTKKTPIKGKRKAAASPAKEEIKSPTPEVESAPNSVSNLRKRNQSGSQVYQEKNENRPESVSKKSDVSSKVSIKGGKRTPNKKNPKEKNKTQSDDEEEITPPKPKKGKKSTEADISQQSQPDIPESEKRTGRPMRKTKEAATIYMELIGLKLNLDEFDEDDSSMDSFPALPNAKQTQKMENELKQNTVKQKPKAKPVKRNTKAIKAAPKKKLEVQLKTKIEEAIEDQEEPSKLGDLKKIDKLEKSFSDSDDEPLVTQKVEKENTVKPKPKGKAIKKQPKAGSKAVAKKNAEPRDQVQVEVGIPAEEDKKNLPKQEIIEKKKILEKSFSDSDDEPLATKLAPKPVEKEIKEEALHIITEIIPITTPKTSPIKPEKLISPNKIPIKPRPDERTFIKSPSPAKKLMTRPEVSIPTTSTPVAFPPSIERFPSPKVNPTFLTPKFDRNLERKIPLDPISSPLSMTKNSMPSPTVAKLEVSLPKPTSPSTISPNVKKFEPDTILSANLMPSKEESGKIFGIASVSLAQSSGPDNTKCTLGKCGSIHKPVLGPVVPTEAYLGEQLSSKERRKAKVNMTHEQIQKWLIECSSNPDDIHDDLDDDFDEPLKPKTFAPTPPLVRDEKDSGSLISKTGKDVKSESTWSGKGPSLKATPVVLKEESRPSPLLPTELVKQESPFESRVSPKLQKSSEPTPKEKTASPIALKKSEPLSKIIARDTVKSPKPSTSSATSSPKHLKNARTANITQKKLPMPKRQPVYNTKATTEAGKKKPQNSFAAFSPENETSVYSFDKEDDVPPPVAKPFRRHSRRESNTEDNTPSEKPAKAEKSVGKDVQQNSISVTLSPEQNNKSIKVSLEGGDTATQKAEKPPADASAVGDSDSEAHTFYIPLQGAGTTTTNCGKSDVIQGVAVKLGREGPEGPNQRVIMHATLVTKAQMGSNTTPIPESMNVHEIVKSILSTNKETPTSVCSKSVPIGTVQPRFKSTTDTQNASGSGLTRVNSNSSLFSGSTKSKQTATAQQKKPKDAAPIKIHNNTAFPRRDDPTQMVEAPIFRPTEKEFQDPMEFIERITPIAARFGICKIIPPDSFKPECRVSDDMRFTAYNQYVHKMLHRWGPSAKEFSAIKKYLGTQSIAMTHPPWIGGMEVDLPRLYHTVQELGGLKEVIEKKKWARVAEEMCIPKLAQDRVTKLDDIYCKYLLPYDTLSPSERQKLFDEVEADWAKREARARRNADRCVNLESVSNEDGEDSTEDDDDSDDEVDGVSMECIVKGRSMALNAFFRIARNTMALWFKNTEPSVTDIEAEFWRHVAVRDSHVCVHSGSIDSSGWGYGFPTPGPKTKSSPCAKHPWNLKVLTNNSGSVLRSLGPVMGVTVPTLHVGMLFSACCWYRDPHGLSWIEYLHTGASKIWYGIPDDQSSNFRTALTALIPTHCQNKTIWLPCDTVMVPPHMLTDRGVSLCRIEQKPGEYVVVFPRAYTSSVASGYVVSESVYFATSSWLDSARDDFKDIHESCEPAIFSLEQLLFAIASDQRVVADISTQILPMISEVYEKELAARQQLKASGLMLTEKFQPAATKSKQKFRVSEEHECDLCRANLYISMVKTTEGSIYCLQHALKNINNGNIQAKQCTLIFTYDIEDIENLMKKLKDRFTQQLKKGAAGNVTTSKKMK